MNKCDQGTRLNPYQYGFYLSALADPSNKSYIVRFALKFRTPIHENQLPLIQQWMRELPEIFANLEFHENEPVLVSIEPRIEICPEDQCHSIAQSAALSLNDDRLYRVYAAKSENAITHIYFLIHHVLVDQTGVETVISHFSTFLQEGGIEKYPGIIPETETFAAEQDFWLKTLEGFEPAPLVDPDCTAQTHTIQFDKIKVAKSTGSMIDLYCQSHYITPAIFFFGVFSFVISALTRSNRVLLGTVVNASPEQDRYISCFANTSLFAMDFSDIENIEALWSRASEAMFNVIEQRKIPFWMLKEAFSKYRKEDLEIPFFISFSERHAQHHALFSWDYLADSHPKFPLNIAIIKEPESYLIECNFDTHCYSRRFISQVMSMINTTVHKLIQGRPDVNLQEPGFFTPSPPSVSPPSFTPLVNTFEDHARQNERPCYIGERSTFSLLEINRQASAMATKLSQLGVGPGNRVIVEAVRDHRFIVAILAIWKLGASFVPVEDDIPVERLRKVESATQASVFLVADIQVNTSAIQTDFEAFACDDRQLSTSAVNTVEKEAYVVFTSGSTGDPKGVSVSHGNVAHYADAMVKTLSEMLGDTPLHSLTFAAVSTLSSDLGYTSVFTALTLGARLTILSKKISLNAVEFSDAINHRQVDVLKIAPTHFASLASACDISRLLPQKVYISGGEVLSRALHDEIKRYGIRVLNHYGPTETTVGVATWHDQISAAAECSTPLGRPLGLNQILITDHCHRILPSGFEGEIVVLGPGVSQGYLSGKNTAFFTLSGARAYATGDNGWQDFASCLHFRQRKDQQFKINGHRVEMAEIESALSRHIPTADYSLQFRKGSFVLFTRDKYQPVWGEVLAALAQELPGYMLPSATYFLPVLPMTASGKTDKQKLLSLEHQRNSPDPGVDNINPLIIRAWEKHIGTPGSVHDSIYFQGANSIRAIQLLADIARDVGHKIPLGAFLRNPRLSYFLDLNNIRHDVSEPLSDSSSRASMTSMQKSMWNLNQVNPGDPAYNVPLLLDMKRTFSKDALSEAVKRLVESIDMLRVTFSSEKGDVTCIRDDNWYPEIEERDISDAGPLLNELMRCQFTLDTRPPFRVFFSGNTVLLVLHHIITDNLSNRLILDVLDEALDGSGDTSLVKIHSFHPTFSHLETSEISQYWKNKLRNVKHITAWPTAIIQPRTEEVKVQGDIPASTAEALSKIFSSDSISLQSGLLSIYGLAASLFFNRSEILVYIPVTLRRTEACFRQIGCGISTLPILIKTHSDTPVIEQIRRARNAILDDLDNQHIDFQDLVNSACLINKNGSLKSNMLFSYEEETPNDWRNFSKRNLETSPPKFDICIDIVRKTDKSLTLTLSSKIINKSTLQALLKSFTDFATPSHFQSECTLEEYALKTANKPLEGRVNIPPHGTVSSAIYEAILVNQDKCAIYEGEREYRYKTLLNAASAIGEMLSNSAPETPVIVFLHRSFQAIASLLATVLSGRTLIPIDGTSPAGRLKAVTSRLTEYILIDDVYLSKIDLFSEREFTFSPEKMHPRSPLYMIFTSGSTGVPKGVPIRDKQFYNYLSWARTEYNVEPRSVVPLFTSLSYDLTLTSVFLPLLTGASIDIIQGSNGIETMSNLADRDKYYQLIKMTPTHLSILNQLMEERKLYAGCVVIGGEQLHSESLIKIAPAVPVYNEYGPAETTVGCCLKKTFSYEKARGPVSIGTPAPGCSMLITGQHGQSLPEGIAGNIIIRGNQVFEGYFNQETHTLSLDKMTGQPQYATGDCAYLLDGEIHYIGRQDRQIKLDGHRIELEEIEHVIQQMNGVTSAQVEVYKEQGSQHLIAILGGEKWKGSLDAIKKQMVIKLPSHMNPKYYFSYDEVEIGDSGKLDIEKMIRSRTKVVAEIHEIPSSKVRHIWTTLLGKASFSDHANFFDAGGNSTLLLQLCRELSHAFQKNVRPIDLLSFTTVAQQEVFFTEGAAVIAPAPDVMKASRRRTTPTDFLTRRNRG